MLSIACFVDVADRAPTRPAEGAAAWIGPRSHRLVFGVIRLVRAKAREQTTMWRRCHQHRIVRRSGRAGRHDVGHSSSGSLRRHREKGLVFHLLATSQSEGRPGVPIQEEPKCLGQKLGIRRIAPVDGDSKRGGTGLSGEAANAPFLSNTRGDGRGRNIEILEEGLHLGNRWQTDRRSEDQANGRRAPPPEGKAGEYRHRHS